ncbi:glycoside hydrolase [Fusarium agapanthi]|uniref:Glycoside hydrolase n=1 Tax=Fusarium agapanthi TaxID=1803897 RepID=A0A9P5AZR4_9HYPO|nr:glycoside hydrolase [Fusarium agapanthi]
MKSFNLLALCQALLVAATPYGSKLPARQQSNSFAGVNSFFLHAFKQQDILDVLDAIKDANLKVLRIFISPTGHNAKNSGSISMPHIEPRTVGVWDDTQLKAIDQLTIAIHDRYKLGCWGSDATSSLSTPTWAANKLMLFEEFGATGRSKSTTVGQHIDVFNGLGVPWMPWQISKPGNKASDYEFWTDEPTYDVVEDGSNDALAKSAAQTWSI